METTRAGGGGGGGGHLCCVVRCIACILRGVRASKGNPHSTSLAACRGQVVAHIHIHIQYTQAKRDTSPTISRVHHLHRHSKQSYPPRSQIESSHAGQQARGNDRCKLTQQSRKGAGVQVPPFWPCKAPRRRQVSLVLLFFFSPNRHLIRSLASARASMYLREAHTERTGKNTKA